MITPDKGELVFVEGCKTAEQCPAAGPLNSCCDCRAHTGPLNSSRLQKLGQSRREAPASTSSSFSGFRPWRANCSHRGTARSRSCHLAALAQARRQIRLASHL